MAGNQVLEWIDLDSEIKTAGLKTVSAAFCYMPLADNITEQSGSLGSS